MIWHEYRLGDTISKATEPLTLWETAKGLVQIDKNTLTIPVMLGDRLEGYVFHGHGRLILDMIIETERGAIGRPIEERIDQPFIMLGETETVQSNLAPASPEDFSVLGYMKQQEFIDKVEDLLDNFHGRSLRIGDCGFSDVEEGVVFAFQKGAFNLDILLAKRDKIVYKTRGTVFVSNGEKAVLKSSDGLVCVSNGRSVIVRH
jgi:hypothetical protein